MNKKYLVQGGRQAVGMIGSGAGGARDKVFAGLLATDETVLHAGGLVDALVAVPVAIGDLIDGWFEAVRVISLVTTEINFSGVFVCTANNEHWWVVFIKLWIFGALLN